MMILVTFGKLIPDDVKESSLKCFFRISLIIHSHFTQQFLRNAV